MKPFRFGLVAAQAGSAEEWLGKARRAESLGYSTLLVPDRVATAISPLPALAAAAAVTSDLHVGTFVLACGLRNPAVLAHECATLDLLSGDRFEVGLGTGVSEEDFRRAGVDFGTPGQRLTRLAETIAALRAGGSRRPVLVAGSGRRVLALAAREADIIGLAAPPTAAIDEVREKSDWIREAAGTRLADLEINLNLIAAGNHVDPRFLARFGLDLSELRRLGSLYILSGGPEEMRDQLLARREALGASYITINDAYIEALAPVVELLAGR
ncbi:MAG: TIGR03621 family F420-dependent LLM class oxidoreductase [Chloroflexota bacterium]